MQASSTRFSSLRAGTRIETSGASLFVKLKLDDGDRDLLRFRPRSVRTTITSQLRTINQSALMSIVNTNEYSTARITRLFAYQTGGSAVSHGGLINLQNGRLQAKVA